MDSYFYYKFNFLFLEPMTGVEPVTSSLPRMRSATELHRRIERETEFESATLSLEG